MSFIAKKQTGFTIVELLIVVVVIAILAAISIVAYTGIQTRADTSSRLNEMMSWKRAFEVYRASEGTWPSTMATNTYYCLGKGFPIGAGGVARCRDYQTTATGYLESDNNALMNQIGIVTNISASEKKPIGATVGPYAYLDNSTKVITITQLFQKSIGQCPDPTSLQYEGWAGLWCQVQLQ